MTTRRANHVVQRQRIERVIELYLRDCYRQRTAVRVSELAQYLGTNRTYLSRTVPAVLGMPLRDASRRRQLAYAARLLRTTRRPVNEIALRAAFGHPSTFFRLFRAAFDQSPAAFRAKATNCE